MPQETRTIWVSLALSYSADFMRPTKSLYDYFSYVRANGIVTLNDEIRVDQCRD
jgi:hypothetical protein